MFSRINRFLENKNNNRIYYHPIDRMEFANLMQLGVFYLNEKTVDNCYVHRLDIIRKNKEPKFYKTITEEII